MSEFHDYNVAKVSISLLGVLVEGGYASDEVITVIMTNDRFKVYEGADGSVSRADTNSRLAKVELHLAQTNPTNAALAAAFAAGVVGPIEILDLNGSSLHVASKAWIMKAPDAAYKQLPDKRTWVFEAADMSSFVGGQVT
jgi:hypothetical protein